MSSLNKITIMLCLLLVLRPAYSALNIPSPGSFSDAFSEGLHNGMQMARLQQDIYQRQQQIRMMQEKRSTIINEKLYQYIKSAQLGDPDSALSVGNIFNERVPYNNTREGSINDLISAFAWFQVSMMLGKETYIGKNGDIVALSIFLNDCRKQNNLNKKELKRADEMAVRICSNIPKCAQKLNLKG